MQANVKEKIQEILIDCGIDKDRICSNDFVSEGVLDSLTMAEIIVAIEDVFQIEIDADEIVPENFQNVSTISNLIEKCN